MQNQLLIILKTLREFEPHELCMMVFSQDVGSSVCHSKHCLSCVFGSAGRDLPHLDYTLKVVKVGERIYEPRPNVHT